MGMMIGVELVKYPVTRERNTELQTRCCSGCFSKGVPMLEAGPNSLRQFRGRCLLWSLGEGLN
jgi:4-aminobutyrate aminotransferase-like enzyme